VLDKEKISKLRISQQDPGTPPPRRKRRWLPALLLAGIAAVAATVLYQKGLLAPAVSVRTASAVLVYPSQAVTDFNASGYIVAQRKAAVSSKGTGRLETMEVREGSRVKDGDVLARLENDDLREERAQAAAQLNTAGAELARAQSELLTAEKHWNRLKGLWYDRRAVAQSDYEAAEDRYLKAKAAIEAARANIAAQEANLRRISVLIEYTIIRAPFDGVVLKKDADVGEVVAPFGSATNAKAAVVTMADMTSLMVEADVAESFLHKVREGQPCEIRLDSIPDERFTGTVFTVVPTADRTKGTVLVKVRFDALDPRILPDMSAKVAFLTRPLASGELQPRLGIHRDALTQRDGISGVFAVDREVVRWVPISSPTTLGDFVLVGDRVPQGTKVVLKPPDALKQGGKIQISES